MAGVCLEGVYKIYPGDVTAVKDFNLEITDREFMVFVGPSGCGKSTTLRMVAGLETISKGRISIGGRVMNNVLPKDRNIAMVFQNYALYPHMSVYKNMAFGLKLKKMPPAEIEQRVRKAADMLGITEYLDRKPKALSGGQRQRVAVGRAIVRQPRAFLFDEPLSNLDARMRVQMRREISKLHVTLQSTMIYVTHDQVEAMTMGDRICVMKDGLIQQVDTPLNIYERPANKFVAGFIGSPPMNFFKGSWSEGVFRAACGFSITPLAEHAAKLSKQSNGEIIFGVRPENLQIIDSKNPPPASFSAAAEVIEPMGAETYLYLRIGNNPLVARVDGRICPQPGENLTLSINLSATHFFDRKTERLLV